MKTTFLVVITLFYLSFPALAQSTSSPQKETLRERLIRDGFTIDSVSKEQMDKYKLMIKLDKQRKAKAQTEQKTKKITYTLKSTKKLFIYYLRTPPIKKVRKEVV